MTTDNTWKDGNYDDVDGMAPAEAERLGFASLDDYNAFLDHEGAEALSTELLDLISGAEQKVTELQSLLKAEPLPKDGDAQMVAMGTRIAKLRAALG